MKFRIENLLEKKLIGKCIKMSLSDNKTFLLWNSFMKQRSEIKDAIETQLYSVQIYELDYFKEFDPAKTFVKWACVEVNSDKNIPDGMEAYTLKGGKYAVFNYIGNPSEGSKVFQYIFQDWLPSSGYELDARAHFEVLGEKYKNDSEDSEEEIWVPIK